jgi:hypothetical protein
MRRWLGGRPLGGRKGTACDDRAVAIMDLSGPQGRYGSDDGRGGGFSGDLTSPPPGGTWSPQYGVLPTQSPGVARSHRSSHEEASVATRRAVGRIGYRWPPSSTRRDSLSGPLIMGLLLPLARTARRSEHDRLQRLRRPAPGSRDHHPPSPCRPRSPCRRAGIAGPHGAGAAPVPGEGVRAHPGRVRHAAFAFLFQTPEMLAREADVAGLPTR